MSLSIRRFMSVSGLTFVSRATGFVNVVIWKSVFQKYMVLAKTTSFLGISGTLQKDSGVVHLVAESLWDPTTRRRPRKGRSRDFH